MVVKWTCSKRTERLGVFPAQLALLQGVKWHGELDGELFSGETHVKSQYILTSCTQRVS